MTRRCAPTAFDKLCQGTLQRSDKEQLFGESSVIPQYGSMTLCWTWDLIEIRKKIALKPKFLAFRIY